MRNTNVIVLSLLPLLEIVFLGLEFDDALPELLCLHSQFLYSQVLDVKGLDAD